MAKTQTLIFKRTLGAKAADLYEALTSSTLLRQWYCDTALVDPTRGGRFYAEWNAGYYAAGEFLAAVPGKRLAFTWHGRGEPAATCVSIVLSAKKAGTTITITHTGIGTGKPWAKTAKALAAGWETALENLAAAFASGEDQRISLRPMLGIMLDSFDAATARKLGVPVEIGVRLSGTVPGMGAEAAGLQKDDVVVGIGGRQVSASTLGGALQGRKGGDTVAVKYYRGSQLRTTKMRLSKRPLPDIPAGPAELAAALQKTYAEINVELDKALDAVTEAEASARPAPGEWNAKDVLCHLVVSERGTQAIYAEMIDGHLRQYDTTGGNVEAQHTALLAVRPAYRDQLEEFKRARRETVAFFAAVPPAVAANRSTWWTMCFQNLQPPLHDQCHVTQMREAIAAARKSQASK